MTSSSIPRRSLLAAAAQTPPLPRPPPHASPRYHRYISRRRRLLLSHALPPSRGIQTNASFSWFTLPSFLPFARPLARVCLAIRALPPSLSPVPARPPAAEAAPAVGLQFGDSFVPAWPHAGLLCHAPRAPLRHVNDTYSIRGGRR